MFKRGIGTVCQKSRPVWMMSVLIQTATSQHVPAVKATFSPNVSSSITLSTSIRPMLELVLLRQAVQIGNGRRSSTRRRK